MQPRQGGIWLVLGGAPGVWADLERARAVLAGQGHGIIACNLAGVEYPGDIHGFASLHPEHMAKWASERAAKGGNADFRSFIPSRHPNCPAGAVVLPRWDGSSGLYAAEVALSQFAAGCVILCGVPMDPAEGHFAIPGFWSGGTHYRKAFVAALPTLGGRLRSMSGWTAQVYGQPTVEWLDAAADMKSTGRPRPFISTRPPMYDVKNVSDTTQRFNVASPDGGFDIVRLAPGESGAYDVDPGQMRFQEGGPLTATLIAPAKAAEPPKASEPEPTQGAETPDKPPKPAKGA